MKQLELVERDDTLDLVHPVDMDSQPAAVVVDTAAVAGVDTVVVAGVGIDAVAGVDTAAVADTASVASNEAVALALHAVESSGKMETFPSKL